jgi:aryl-alcohol dehydrogenase-like predicted oxidoreductase
VPFVELRSAGGSGLGVSVLGLGTMGWGANTDAHEARELLKIFADAVATLSASCQALTPATPT